MNISLKSWGLDSRKYSKNERLLSLVAFFVYFILAVLSFAWIDVVRLLDFSHGIAMPIYNPHLFLAASYFCFSALSLFGINYFRRFHNTGNLFLVVTLFSIFLGTTISVICDFLIQVIFVILYTQLVSYDGIACFLSFLNNMKYAYLIAVAMILGCILCRWRLRVYFLNVQREVSDTSGNLGKARLATESDITAYGLRVNKGVLIGKDRVGYLRMPELTDRLIVAYRGAGKTSSILIPLILDYLQVNKFIMDIKGELTAVTARKAVGSGRAVYVLDFFDVVKKSLGISIKTHHINPLAYISDDENERDRQISALALVLGTTEYAPRNETESHFIENAQIIIEGILEFFIDTHKDVPERLNFVGLHDWWLDIVNGDYQAFMDAFKQGSLKARAAASQMSQAGKDEGGSFRTTIYRQIQWLRSKNIRDNFMDNEVSMDDFVSGNADIYVVVPEDMIKPFSRVVRLVMAIIKTKIIQTPTAELKKHYLLILDELGQMGYCPDIENISNTTRSKGVYMAASFNSTQQIEAYKDKAVFRSMPVKHFLGGDDPDIVAWIQKMGDKTTVLTENTSSNISKNGKYMTTSESRGVSETSTDLIKFSDISLLPNDEQYVFIKGLNPIRCKKAYYFNEPIYAGRYDYNPLEDKSNRRQ